MSKKYIAWLNDVTSIELTEEKFNEIKINIAVRYGKEIPCKQLIPKSKNGNEFFILFPIQDFEIEVQND